MGIDILSKFLSVSGDKPPAQNDNAQTAAFSTEETTYVADMLQKYGLFSRRYDENEGERIDIFFGRMQQQYNLPSISLTRTPESRDASPYKFMTSGSDGFIIPSNNFSGIQTMLSGLLMKHFQKQKLRSLDA